MPPHPWCQVNISFPDYARAEKTAVTHLAPLLTTAEADGLLIAWFFIRKRPCWRVRYLPPDNAPNPQEHLHTGLSNLQRAQLITRATTVVYEPETHAFGGPQAMATAHRLWHLDSHHLLTYLAATADVPATRRRRELSILLCSTMLRAAGLDWYEQGDVWARVAAHRDPPDHLGPEGLHTMSGQVHRLMTLDTSGPLRVDEPLARVADWAAAFAAAGRELASLNSDGLLDRGLRAILAHHIVFASNRLGLPTTTQAILATTARTVVLGRSPPASRPTTSHDELPTRPATIIGTTGKQP